MDLRALGEAISYPGIDPRTWVSFGKVAGGDDPEVVFDEEYGPLVSVVLQPSRRPVLCRVGAFVAGNGEGQYHPFINGDEVLVAIPGGNERGECVILCRLNNAFDKFPMESVAGQDPTTNTFGFTRARTPMIHEYAGPVIFRSAISGAMMAIDTGGTLTLRGGDEEDNAAPALQISPDVIGFQSADASKLLQLAVTEGRLNMQVDDAVMTLSSTASGTNSFINVPGLLSLYSGGNVAAEHAISAEAVVHIVHTVLSILGKAIAATGITPLTGVSLGAIVDPSPAPGPVAATIPAALTKPMDTFVGAAMQVAFSVAPQKTPATFTPATGQTMPGIGCAALFIG